MKIRVVVLGLTVLASALSTGGFGAIVYFDTDDPLVLAGETISVRIVSDLGTGDIRMDKISDNGGGTASNLYLNPGYDAPVFRVGTAINSGGILIEGVRGMLGYPGSPTVSGTLYSFDYTVSASAVNGQIITIFPDSSGGAINEVDIVGMVENVTPESLSVTVVPEPATILLVGLGGVVLVNRNRQRNRRKH